MPQKVLKVTQAVKEFKQYMVESEFSENPILYLLRMKWLSKRVVFLV